MKITSIETFVLSVPTRKPMALEFADHRLVVAIIQTDEGLTGLGYSLAFGGGGAEAIQVYLETRLKPLLLGEDPLFVERLWERMYRADRGIKRQGVAAYALSALDIGLWDLVGKAASLPLHKLWGAVTDRVAAYGSGGWGSYATEDIIGEAQHYARLGCRYYKMKVHHPDPRVNRQRVEAVRKALGDGVRLMVDVNQRLDVLGNIRQAALLEDLDLVWYEEPVLADELRGQPRIEIDLDRFGAAAAEGQAVTEPGDTFVGRDLRDDQLVMRELQRDRLLGRNGQHACVDLGDFHGAWSVGPDSPRFNRPRAAADRARRVARRPAC